MNPSMRDQMPWWPSWREYIVFLAITFALGMFVVAKQDALAWWHVSLLVFTVGTVAALLRGARLTLLGLAFAVVASAIAGLLFRLV